MLTSELRGEENQGEEGERRRSKQRARGEKKRKNRGCKEKKKEYRTNRASVIYVEILNFKGTRGSNVMENRENINAAV